MKIVIATGIYPPEVGGPANYAKELKEKFENLDHEVRVLPFRKFGYLPTGLRHFVYFLNCLTLFVGKDAVIALDTYSVGFPSVLAGNLLGKRVIIRTGGDFLWEEYIERTEEKIVLSRFYKEKRNFSLKEKIVFFVTRFTLRMASFIVFSTIYQREIFTQAYGLNKNKTRIIENAYIAPSCVDSVLPTKRIFFCAVRRLSWKNSEMLVRVFDEICKKNPEIRLDLRFDIPREEVLKGIKGSYATILVSLGDISPNFILESISFCRPLILTKETGLYDRLRKVAFFVDPLDREDIKEKVLELAREDVYMERISALKDFSFEHSYGDIAKEFLDLIKPLT